MMYKQILGQIIMFIPKMSTNIYIAMKSKPLTAERIKHII